jgi:hypothetical protein
MSRRSHAWCIVGNRKFVEIDRAIRALPEPGGAKLRDCHRMIPVVALAPLTPFARRTARSGRRGEESPLRDLRFRDVVGGVLPNLVSSLRAFTVASEWHISLANNVKS